jgi:hypothetical protein
VIISAVFATAYRQIARPQLRERSSLRNIWLLALGAALLHVAMDVCGWQGAALLWPFSSRRFALDWAPNTDPTVIATLVGALLFPELLHLVNSEIGSRTNRPRGWIGARIGLALIMAYTCARAYFHSTAVALMDSRSFRGEVPRRVGAFPESLSPVTWHGVVETERAMHTLTMITGPLESFDPEGAETLFKPDPSVALQSAVQTEAAKQFLSIAQFPKASLENTPARASVEIRDLCYEAVGETNHEVVAVIQLDPTNRVLSAALRWAR